MILHLLLSQFTKYIAIGNNYTFFRGLTPCGTNLISFENIHLIWVRHSHSVYGTFFKLEISNSFYIILYKLGRVTWNHLVLRRDGATLLRYFFFLASSSCDGGEEEAGVSSWTVIFRPYWGRRGRAGIQEIFTRHIAHRVEQVQKRELFFLQKEKRKAPPFFSIFFFFFWLIY